MAKVNEKNTDACTEDIIINPVRVDRGGVKSPIFGAPPDDKSCLPPDDKSLYDDLFCNDYFCDDELYWTHKGSGGAHAIRMDIRRVPRRPVDGASTLDVDSEPIAFVTVDLDKIKKCSPNLVGTNYRTFGFMLRDVLSLLKENG